MLGVVKILLTLASGLFSFFQDKQKEQVGAIKEDNKTMTEIVTDVEKAKKARDDLGDPAVADKLRDKYQRD